MLKWCTSVEESLPDDRHVYKRADTLGAGEPYTYGLPPDYVRIAMAVAVMAFAAQMVSYTGREWAIHKQAGRPIRRVPSFWNNIFNVAMLCMYLAVAVVIAGLIQMQQPSQLQDLYGSLPLSSGIFCSNSLLVLYFAVYAGLQIAKTMDVDFRERGTYPESLTDPSRYIIEVLKMTASEVQVAPMRLPRDFRSGANEIVKEDIHTSIEVPPLLSSSGATLSIIFRKLITYQTQQGHHQAPGRLQRLTSFSTGEANNCDNFHAKRVVCELLKAWACCSQGAVSDEGIDAQEVDPYLNYLRHVMYYHDRWSSKLWGSDAFLETIVHVIRKLEALKRDTSDKRQKYLKVLEQIHDHTSELAEHALRVTLLANTEHHSEFEALVAKEGALTLKSLSQTLVRHSTSFWCTDFGQVLYSALVRADPQRFKPVGVGVEVAARTWSLWTDELGTIKTYEYSSPEEARLVLEQCRCCTILVGPEGKIQEKSFASSTSQVLSKVLQEGSTMRELNRRVDQNIGLQQAALGMAPPTQVTAIEDFLGDGESAADEEAEKPDFWRLGSIEYEAVEKAAVGHGGLKAVEHTNLQPSHYDLLLLEVRDAWMQGNADQAGIAEPFRGCKKVKWIDGVFEKESRSSNFPTIILESWQMAYLLCCFKQVMTAVRSMISEGGSKEALAAIYALRQRSTITGQLDACMQKFLTSANLMHGFFEHLFFEGLENNKKIKGQSAAMQRLYFESHRACNKLRDEILTKWHKLGLEVSDDNLAEEAKRIDMTEKAAFCQLMGALTTGYGGECGTNARSAGPLLQLPDSPKEEASPTNDVVTAKPVAFSPSARIEDGLWQILELAVFCVGVQLTVDAHREELPSTVETAMYICCLSLFVQAAVATATPFITRAELKVVPGTVDIVDFATGHPRLYIFMSSLRWVSTAAMYLGVCVICAHLWRQTDEPVWVILVMHLGTYFFIVHFCLFLCVSIRQLSNVSMLDGIRTLTTAKDTVSICPMLSVLFIECWVAANDIRTPAGLPGVPQGFAQDYMFVATWAMLMQLVVCFVNGFVYTLPKDSKVMRLCGNSLRGGLTAISIVFYLTLVTVYASILVVLVSRYTNTPRAATGVGAWFA
eukprot:s1975_g14.t2